MSLKQRNLYIKDWRFWFKIAAIFIGLFAILGEYINGMVNISNVWRIPEGSTDKVYVWALYDAQGNLHWDYAGYTVFFLSFFTIQTNILVVLWFIFAAIWHTKEGVHKFLKPYFSLAVAVYISITCIVYNLVLLPVGIANSGSGKGSALSAFSWVIQTFLHFIVPMLCIIYVIFFLKKDNLVSNKQFIKKYYGNYVIYVVVYGVYAIIRGLLREFSGKLVSTAYPYFFLQVTAPKILGLPGYAWFIIVVFVLLAMILGFATLYNFAFNRLNKKKQLTPASK
ncbi:hypothetical protein SSYRP_v1c07510 [Spiroplasma syrphidicola EA-1]|uniref:Transmembrane protein n=1 Tax=Spiroplasma syrphidicola EA-1 TaxID=1276229 RepID=R4UM81_9MOLU|nr:Pr6Pr family membrane protein [Spiroplasma syrphidicola]AGM26341.1 hypothetical protein SSYRP_v1c07510 [Spiroplasma syrphidicola EA-1]